MRNCFSEGDDHRKIAGRELYRQIKKSITLSTPGGDIVTDVTIIYRDEEEYSDGEKREGPSVFVSIVYDGTNFVGEGKDYLWEDAFADLQKKLPGDVRIKCCLTCRYGNMCPVGDVPGELFCMKDVTVKQKSDLFFYTEDQQERDKRSREDTDLCECYCEQSDQYYTYNDYLYYLQRSFDTRTGAPKDDRAN